MSTDVKNSNTTFSLYWLLFWLYFDSWVKSNALYDIDSYFGYAIIDVFIDTVADAIIDAILK